MNWPNIKKHQIVFSKLDEETQEEVLELVGRKADYYEKRWKSETFFSWNWSSFLFGTFWFAFRKMNVYAYFLLGTITIFEVLSIMILKKNIVSSTTFAGTFLFIALIGNQIYFDFAVKKVKRIKSQYSNREERLAMLRKIGGVSWLHAIIFVFVLIVQSFSINFLEEKVYYNYAAPKFLEAAELQKSGKLDEAVEIYDKIENQNFPIVEIYYNKALIHGSREEYNQALENIEKYLELLPNDNLGMELKESLLNDKQK